MNTKTWDCDFLQFCVLWVDCPVLPKQRSSSAQSSSCHWGTSGLSTHGFSSASPSVRAETAPPSSTLSLVFKNWILQVMTSYDWPAGLGIVGKKKREMDRQLDGIITPLHLQKPAKNPLWASGSTVLLQKVTKLHQSWFWPNLHLANTDNKDLPYPL